MKTEYIEKILEKFYNGETIPAEELLLYEYFSQYPVVKKLEKEKNSFLHIYSLKKEESLPEGAKARLEVLIDELARKEEIDNKRISLWKWVGGVAASVIIFLVAGWYIQENNSYDTPLLVDTYTNPQDAYEETYNALLLMSAKMNKGFERLESIEHNLDKKSNFINTKLNAK